MFTTRNTKDSLRPRWSSATNIPRRISSRPNGWAATLPAIHATAINSSHPDSLGRQLLPCRQGQEPRFFRLREATVLDPGPGLSRAAAEPAIDDPFHALAAYFLIGHRNGPSERGGGIVRRDHGAKSRDRFVAHRAVQTVDPLAGGLRVSASPFRDRSAEGAAPNVLGKVGRPFAGTLRVAFCHLRDDKSVRVSTSFRRGQAAGPFPGPLRILFKKLVCDSHHRTETDVLHMRRDILLSRARVIFPPTADHSRNSNSFVSPIRLRLCPAQRGRRVRCSPVLCDAHPRAVKRAVATPRFIEEFCGLDRIDLAPFAQTRAERPGFLRRRQRIRR